VDYLGFSISDEGLEPARKKVEALLKVSPPNTNKALLSFLLSVNFITEMKFRGSVN
jgi:hypothetical protein